MSLRSRRPDKNEDPHLIPLPTLLKNILAACHLAFGHVKYPFGIHV
jgi:hypothetical protein